MVKKFLIFLLTIVVLATIYGSIGNIVLAKDLCGGTGGNGQVVKIDDNGFTMKRNDDGRNQIIHLTKETKINTSDGEKSLSYLKTGDRVTLVGGPNSDGSFSADNVFVCDTSQGNITKQEAQAIQEKRNKHFNNVQRWSLYINTLVLILVGLTWVNTLAVLRFIKKKNFVYLLFFTIFYIYIVKVLDYTIFQYQSLIILKHFASGLMLNGQTADKSLNLIPLIGLKPEDMRTSLLNILLMIPFGFGLPFVTDFRFKKILICGALFSMTIEILQFVTGLIAKITFRIADINDLIFNTTGVIIGYILFLGFLRLYRVLLANPTNSILRYIGDRPQIEISYK